MDVAARKARGSLWLVRRHAMHEFSVIRAVLREAETIARREGAERVTAMTMSVGEFSGVEADLLPLAFQELAPGTPAAGAELTIHRLPLEARCRRCEHRFVVRQFRFTCPECQGRDVAVVRGDELLLETVTLEWSDDASGSRRDFARDPVSA